MEGSELREKDSKANPDSRVGTRASCWYQSGPYMTTKRTQKTETTSLKPGTNVPSLTLTMALSAFTKNEGLLCPMKKDTCRTTLAYWTKTVEASQRHPSRSGGNNQPSPPKVRQRRCPPTRYGEHLKQTRHTQTARLDAASSRENERLAVRKGRENPKHGNNNSLKRLPGQTALHSASLPLSLRRED